MSEISTPPNPSIIRRFFLSADQQRFRAGWRLLIQTLLLLVIGAILIAVNGFLGRFLDGSMVSIRNQIINFLAITGSVYMARRWLDKRSFESLGLQIDRHTLPDIFAGISITFVQMGLIYVAMLAFGWVRFEGFAWNFYPPNIVAGKLSMFLVVFSFVGWNEELLSRGYHLQTIASGLKLFWGTLLSSALFGLLHLGNPHATWVSTAGIFLGGVFLGYAFVRTKQLWLPIGLHIGLNFFEGVVFGFPVSGHNNYALIRSNFHGPDVWTGGAFGPEAGLIVLPSLIFGSLLIYLYTRRRGDLYFPFL